MSNSNSNQETPAMQHRNHPVRNIAQYIYNRGLRSTNAIPICYGTRVMLTNELFKETTISLVNTETVSCSKWLTNQQIIFGTKCNKLMLYDVNKRKLDNIPLVGDKYDTVMPLNGIRSVEIDASRTLLATTGMSATDIAVYKIPKLEPVCVGRNVHQDMVLSMCWLDDQFLVSGSEDAKMALWKVMPEMVECSHGDNSSSNIAAHHVTQCKESEKVREIKYNNTLKEIVVLTIDGRITIYDPSMLTVKQTIEQPFSQENYCLAVQKNGFYAIGGKPDTFLLDPRTLQVVKKLSLEYPHSSVRSVSFHGDLLTIGTDVGTLLFFDLMADKYLESSINSAGTVKLSASKKYVYRGNGVEMPMDSSDNPPAIYTHCFDQSGIRLFTAGGPLASTVAGNYACIWR